MAKVELDYYSFKKIINSVKSAVSHDDARAALQYIRIQVSKDEIVAAALDGYQLAKFTGTIEDCNQFLTAYLKPISFPKRCPGTYNIITLEVEKNETIVTIPMEYGSLTYRFRHPEDWSIDVDKVLATTDQNRLTTALDANKVFRAMSSFSNSDDRNNLVKVFCSDNKTTPILFTQEDSSGKLEYLILPVRLID